MISVALVPGTPAEGVVLGTRESARLVSIESARPNDPVDVALVDGYAAARTSIEIGEELAQSGRARAVVVHALHITPRLIDAADRAQVAGVVGRQVFGPALVDTLIELAMAPPSPYPVIVRSPDHALNVHERDILVLIGRGLTNDAIAETLTIPVNTVKSVVRSLYRKLDVRNRTGAAMVAHRHALATIADPMVPSYP